LAQDPQLASITNYELFFPFHPPAVRRYLQPVLQRLIDGFGISQFGFNHKPYRLADPTEDDIYLIYLLSPLSAYWGYLFPAYAEDWLNGADWQHQAGRRREWQRAYHQVLQRIMRRSGGRRLVLRSPPHTGRVGLLRELFPQARFVFLVREPVATYYATRRLWRKTILRRYSCQNFPFRKVDRIIFAHYRWLLTSYRAERSHLPPEQLVEIRYEDLQQRPFATLARLYEQWQLPGFAAAAPHLRRRLRQEADYRPTPYDIAPSVARRVQEEWGALVAPWYPAQHRNAKE
jgi:hypothetical protein